ncbi:MAG: LptF/LptG family permease [Flavobacteriia bacterium]|nr:LptF/LptG family permease [Flavobacteriia bacterium]
MKKLYYFSIKSFIGPFFITFCISMFMLIMQFLWKYIDDLIGKGLGFGVILELFFYASATLIPLALPLAMLLSSIMTMGNMAENNELTALKSAGLSLFKILKPLTYVVIVISIFTFLFANFVIPVATMKWRTLIYDIQGTKIASIVKPGTYSTALEGYAIKIREGNEKEFKDIVIHDHSNPELIKTIKAEKGEVYKSNDDASLFFKLSNGFVLEEMNANNLYQNSVNKGYFSGRKSSFQEASYKIDISGFKMSRSDESLFKNEFEMWNILQLTNALDSIKNQALKYRETYIKRLKNEHALFLNKSINFKNTSNRKKTKKVITVDQMSEKDKLIAYQHNISRIRRKNQNIDVDKEFIKIKNGSLNKFYIEINKKFSLSFAVFVLFFVGAPLGAIVKKGGFGAPVVIAALLFLVYYVITEVGLNLAQAEVFTPFFGIWLATLVLLPIAFWLMRNASLDRKLINFTYKFKKNKE